MRLGLHTVANHSPSAMPRPLRSKEVWPCHIGRLTESKHPLDSVCSTMLPMVFCKDALVELSLLSSNEGWVRGVSAICEMYAATDIQRFEVILTRLSAGTSGLALIDGARWLLDR
jgi:hypothetical protein